MNACSPSHQALRASPKLFFAHTKAIGFQDDGDGGLLALGNCAECGTTMAVEVTEEVRKALGLK